jgi:hypothetical protein
MHSEPVNPLIGKSKAPWLCFLLLVLVLAPYSTVFAQSSLKGVIDFHVHSAPDSVARVIDADDVARRAKELGMRGLVLKNHWESTAALTYMVRKMVPGIELFGGVTQDLAVGGINIEAVRHMINMKGGWGRIVWLPTFDSEAQVKYDKSNLPFVPVSRDGHLLPEELAVIDLIAQHPDMVLETGHVSAEEVLLVVHEAHRRGVKHIVITHGMRPPTALNVAQMQEVAADGAFIEFVYNSTRGDKPLNTVSQYADAIRKVGAAHCILASDLGSGATPSEEHPLPPDGLLDFMNKMVKAGIPQADVDLMTKTNPALALGLTP